MEINYRNYEYDLNYSTENNYEIKEILELIFYPTTNVAFCENVELQKQGIDFIVFMENRKYNIEVKTRRKNYNDIALEYLHTFDNGNTIAGWIELLLKSDYLLYCRQDIKNDLYNIWNFKKLQKTWFKNKEEWIKKYKAKNSRNIDYYTWFICVPVNIIYQEYHLEN